MTHLRVIKNGQRLADYTYKTGNAKKLIKGLMAFYKAVYTTSSIEIKELK